jgi:hypothetical protein
MTLQEISELKTQVIGLQLGRKPFLIERMDWREFPNLVARTKIPPPELPTLSPVFAKLPTLSYAQGFVDMDQGF